MSDLSASCDRIGEDISGPLIAVKYSGVYPPGSEGNAFADAMVQFLRRVLAETRPAGVIFDLTELDYSYGDAIGGLAMPLIERRNRFLPAAVVATGGTSRALVPLLEPSFVLGVAGIKLFPTKEDALKHLTQALDRSVIQEITPAKVKQEIIRPAIEEPRGGSQPARDESRDESLYGWWVVIASLAGGLAGWIVQAIVSDGFVYWALPVMWIAAALFTLSGDNLLESFVLLVIVGIIAFAFGRIGVIAERVGFGTIPGMYVAVAASKITFAVAKDGLLGNRRF